jgi:hypothetical protein
MTVVRKLNFEFGWGGEYIAEELDDCPLNKIQKIGWFY